MKTQMFALIGVAAAMAMSGCATVYRVSESASAPAYPQQGPDKPVMRNPSVVVKAAPADKQASRLASSLRATVEGELVARGFDVIAKQPADSEVVLAVSRREASRLSDWRVYEGSASVRVTESASGKLLASESFKAQGKRALDEAAAEAGAKDALAQQVSRWLVKTLPAKKVALPPGPPPPDHMTATLTIAPGDLSSDPMEALRVQRRFMDYVASRPGIVSCVLAKEDPSRRGFTFHVVYEPRSFPGGLLNTIVLDGPNLGGNVKLEISR